MKFGEFLTLDNFISKIKLKFKDSKTKLAFFKKLKLTGLIKIGDVFFIHEEEAVQKMAEFLGTQKQIQTERQLRLKEKSEEARKRSKLAEIESQGKNIVENQIKKLETENAQALISINTSSQPGKKPEFPDDLKWLKKDLKKLKNKAKLEAKDLEFIAEIKAKNKNNSKDKKAS